MHVFSQQVQIKAADVHTFMGGLFTCDVLNF